MNAGYTLVLPLRDVAAARGILSGLDRRLFDRTPSTHFATLSVIPAQQYRKQPLPAVLLFATSFSGPARVHVRELARELATELGALFACCEGFDGNVEKFLRANRHDDTFYSGMQHLSREDVLQHRQLRDAIEDFLDRNRDSLPETAAGVRTEIQKFVRTRTELAWTMRSFAPPWTAWFALHWRTLIVMAVLAALLAATGACMLGVHDAALDAGIAVGWLGVTGFGVLAAILLVAVRDAEREQTYVSTRQPDQRVRELARTQNRRVINEFVIAGPIKEEGRLRPLFLRLSLWIIARVAEGIPGLRGGIDIPTVATARWIAADRGRRLIFISNYTNSAEPYVRDFIDVRDGAQRINLTFGFGRGYPKTRWIVNDGALTDPNGFIYVVTENQHETDYWYGPYADMSIDNIKINRQIREGLFARLDDDEVRAWLQLL